MSNETGKQLSTVSETKQDREAHLWWYAEPAVWTEKMLAALYKGVKGGKWFSLVDKTACYDNLEKGWLRVQANGGAAGVDKKSVEEFEAHLGSELKKMGKHLLEGDYQPQPVRRVEIPKGDGSKRPLGIPTVRDRVVQTAIVQTIEPIFEREFNANSFGFRPGLGCKDALREVMRHLKEGYLWVLDADIRSFFDGIDHEIMMERLKEKISDGKLLGVIERYLKQKIVDNMREWVPEEGTPQGAVLSPLLANIYLHPLDKEMEEKGYRMVRYADDFVVLCKSEREAGEALGVIERFMRENKLSLHPDKTRTLDASGKDGFDFLGYHFCRGGMHWPRKKSIKSFREKVKSLTPRSSGKSLNVIIKSLNRFLKGWFAYFKHSHKWTFGTLDSWTRRRIRSILRKRSKRKGISRGWDHNRWPNAFFAEMGLFSLKDAHQSACKSLCR